MARLHFPDWAVADVWSGSSHRLQLGRWLACPRREQRLNRFTLLVGRNLLAPSNRGSYNRLKIHINMYRQRARQRFHEG